MLLCFAGEENMCILGTDRDVGLCLPTLKPHFWDRTRGRSGRGGRDLLHPLWLDFLDKDDEATVPGCCESLRWSLQKLGGHK